MSVVLNVATSLSISSPDSSAADTFHSIVPVGYPAGDEQPKDKWDPAKVHYGRW